MVHSKLKYIKIQIELPKRIWIGKLSFEFPDCVFLLNYGHAISKSERLIFISTKKSKMLNEIFEFLKDDDNILDLEIIGENIKVHFKLDFLDSLMHEKLTFIYPIIVNRGFGEIELITNPIQVKVISKIFNKVKILKISDDDNKKEDLTLRQKEILDTAFILGYFQYPRKISLTDLAKHLKISKSTLSENLRSAENRIISSYVNKNI